MTLNRRLSVAFGASVLCTVMLGFVCHEQGLRLEAAVMQLADHSITSIFSLSRVNGLAKDLRGKMRSHVVEKDERAQTKIDGEIFELERKLGAELAKLDRGLVGEGERRLFVSLPPRLAAFNQSWQEVRAKSSAHDEKAMERFLSEVMPKFKSLQDGLDQFEGQLKVDVERVGKDSEAATSFARNWSLALLVLSLAVNVGMGLWTIRYASQALNSSVDELRGSAHLISNMARELNEANEQISSGASQQVASIQQTTRSGERVRTMAEQFAQQAGTVSLTVSELNRGMENARTTIEAMVQHMHAIEETSNRIKRLSGLVDSIAFQTHILSLNASIEAARSGEAGRGFEVVAGEVKSLARQSGEAAQETANLIAESLEAVNAGSKSLGEIVGTVRNVGSASVEIQRLVQEIESASRQQARNMSEISTSLKEVEVVSSRTAAAAEQGFAQQREMETQSEALLQVVDDLQSLVSRAK